MFIGELFGAELSESEQFENEQKGVTYLREENQCELDIGFVKPWSNPKEEKYIGYRIKMLDRMICKQVMKNIQNAKIDGMTRLADWTLEYLTNHEDEIIYQKDIERVFGIGKSTIAGTMKCLEKNHFVERKAVEGDARLKQICVTKEGNAHMRMIKESKQTFERQLTRGLTQDEIEQFFAILQKIENNLSYESEE